MLNIEDLLNEIGVKFVTSGKHSSSGWLNLSCPFCSGKRGDHLGYNKSSGYFHCWRCGWHSNLETISKLGGLTFKETKEILKDFNGPYVPRKERSRKINANALDLPRGAGALKKRHKIYLHKRRLEPEEVANHWGVLATSSTPKLPWRLIFPITFNHKIVSYQTRDITGLANISYKACPRDKEVIPHQDICYGLDQALNECILVEGIFDALRFGRGAVATFGISIRKNQLLILAERFKKVFIMFDNEPLAQKIAEETCGKLNMMGVESYIIEWEWDVKDPGDLEPHQAKLIKREI